MRVTILGGGTVGASVARRLCDRKQEVTIVEKNADRA
ncbi:MAG: NAD-binding protein, partial [Thermoguttaceae bacterium]|nr:NAD-binding protein [Thermoguttaceae bacterium]